MHHAVHARTGAILRAVNVNAAVFALGTLGGGSPSSSEIITAAAQTHAALGHVVAPGGGERLVYCGRPLTLRVKVDGSTAPGTRLVAGTGELRGDEGTATHTEGDEVIFVVRGSGYATIGDISVSLTAGAVAFVPRGTSHRLVSTGSVAMEYLWALGPRSSTESFRRAASVGCDSGREFLPMAPVPLRDTAPHSLAVADSGGTGALVVPPGAGERLVYCELPLVLTLKVESGISAVAQLRAAVGHLARGEERGVHRDADEVLYVIKGRGNAIIGDKMIAIEPGSTMFVPQDAPHGLSNDSDEPLEYVVVHSPQASAVGFRRRAAVQGPYCKAAPDTHTSAAF